MRRVSVVLSGGNASARSLWKCDMRKWTTVFWVAIVVAIGTLASSAAPPQKSSAKSLYQRLGGKKGIQSVVNDFAARCAADQRISSYFAQTVADPKRLAAFKS